MQRGTVSSEFRTDEITNKQMVSISLVGGESSPAENHMLFFLTRDMQMLYLRSEISITAIVPSI